MFETAAKMPNCVVQCANFRFQFSNALPHVRWAVIVEDVGGEGDSFSEGGVFLTDVEAVQAVEDGQLIVGGQDHVFPEVMIRRGGVLFCRFDDEYDRPKAFEVGPEKDGPFVPFDVDFQYVDSVWSMKFANLGERFRRNTNGLRFNFTRDHFVRDSRIDRAEAAMRRGFVERRFARTIRQTELQVDVAGPVGLKAFEVIRLRLDIDAVPTEIVKRLRDGMLDRIGRADVDVKPFPARKCPMQPDVFAILSVRQETGFVDHRQTVFRESSCRQEEASGRSKTFPFPKRPLPGYDSVTAGGLMAFVWLIACLAWSPADDPHRDALARYGAGVLKRSRDELIAAKSQFETAAKQEPNAVEPQRSLFRVYLDLGKYTAAVRTGRRVLELDPNDYRLGLALGRVLLDGKQPREAAEVLAKTSQIKSLVNDPSTAVDVYSTLAKAREAYGDFAAAETALIALTEIHRKRAADIRRANNWSVIEQSRMAGLAYERLGLLRVKQSKAAEAGEAFFEAEAIFSGPAQYPTGALRVHRNLARAFAGAGDHAKAIETFRKYVDATPNQYEPLEEYYFLLIDSGTGPRVADELNLALKKSATRPGHDWFQIVAEFHAGAVNALSARNQFAELAQNSSEPARFALVVRTLPIELLVDWYDELAQAAEGQPGKKGDPKAGQLLRVMADAIRESPAASKAFLEHVMALAKMGQARAPGTYEFAAWLAERAGKIEYVETALQFVSRSAPVWERIRPLVMLYERQRRWKDVVTVCEPLQRGRNMSVQAIYTTAFAFAELGQTQQALELVNRLARDDRLFAEGKLSVRMQQARIFVAAGEAKRAVDLIERLFEDAANPTEIRRLRVVLADAYFAMKDVDKAEEQLRAILEDDPDDALALNNLGYNLADRGLKLAEAEAMCRRAVEQDRDDRRRSGDAAPASGTYLDSLGWALFRRGKLDEAKAVLESAVALPDASGDPTVWDHLGDVYFKQGDSEKAKQAWDKAAAAYPETHAGRLGGRLDEVKKKLALVR
jgi:tetratricopeptide (TPR) repeat protein